MIVKEFILMKREKGALVVIAILPVTMLFLYGYTVEMNPKNIPTVIHVEDHSPFVRQFISGLENTGHFKITHQANSEEEARLYLKKNQALYILTINPDFTRKLIHGEKPDILFEVDATDPIASAQAIGSVQLLILSVFDNILVGPLSYLKKDFQPFRLVVHKLYNPQSNSQYYIIPAVIGFILLLTMLTLTNVVAFRDREEGTFECIAASPVKPIEIILGEASASIILGILQFSISIAVALYAFKIPMVGNFFVLFLCTVLYILAELSISLAIAMTSENLLQAIQTSNLHILFSIVLSGFLFPFFGIPKWGQWLGNCLPLTHYLRIIRGIMLKGSTFDLLIPEIWPIVLFVVVMFSVSVLCYKKTVN
jgi:ABC-2 type transport system permease protein